MFVTGETYASGFPTTQGAYKTLGSGGSDVFISKLNSSLTTLLASTLIGEGTAYALAIDLSGNIFVAGGTGSYDYPATPGAYDTSHNGYQDVFVSKLNNSLSFLLASTFIGGSGGGLYVLGDWASALTLDSTGNIFISGFTSSYDYPTTEGAYERLYNGGYYDVFISKFNSSLSTLLASTFIGGSNSDGANALAIDTSGNVFVTGETYSSGFPTTLGTFDTSFNGSINYSDVFVSKLDNDLTTLLASTFIGGQSGDSASSLAIDSSGNVFVTGETSSDDYPTSSGAYDASWNGGSDVFISKFNSSLIILLSSTFIGGGDADYAHALKIDSSGNVFITGQTYSSNYPTTPGAYSTSHKGWFDVFISKLDEDLSVDPIPPCTYSISPFSQSFPSNGGSENFDITTNRNDCTWTATSNVSWITITSTSGGTGNGWVVFWVSTNPTTSSRTGTMTIAEQTFTVTQDGGEVDCTFSIFPTSQSFESPGGTGSISVTTQSSCTWTATSNSSWITITSENSGAGNGTVNYSVSANTSTGQRTGTMTIAGETFTITQEGLTCSFSISPLSQSFDSTGGTGSINITTLTGCTWTATSNDSWVTITSGNSGNGNGTVNYSVSANTGSERTGTMTIAGQTFAVTQEGYQVSECSAWDDVITKYNNYVTGQAGWGEVIDCYNQYAS